MKKRMNMARRRMNHVINELNHALFLSGCQEISLRLLREEGGLRLIIQASFAPESAHAMERTAALLQPAVRNPALVETYWELAGGDQYTSDSEMALVGQMLDTAEVLLDGNDVRMDLYISF